MNCSTKGAALRKEPHKYTFKNSTLRVTDPFTTQAEIYYGMAGWILYSCIYDPQFKNNFFNGVHHKHDQKILLKMCAK